MIFSMPALASAHVAVCRGENSDHAGTLSKSPFGDVVKYQWLVPADTAPKPVALHLSQSMSR